jgi:hypothetical protein
MNCFYHHDRPAVGICKNCQRGLCPDCAAEVRDGLACGGRCEGKVELLSRLVARSRQALSKAAVSYLALGACVCVLAAFLVLLTPRDSLVARELPIIRYLSIPFWVMGGVMILVGIWHLVGHRLSPPSRSDR